MDYTEIQEEIEKLESGDTSYPNCVKLSVLYTVADHMKSGNMPKYSHASSEFLFAVSGAPIDGVLGILDEHMDCIKALYPKEYNNLIQRIKDL